MKKLDQKSKQRLFRLSKNSCQKRRRKNLASEKLKAKFKFHIIIQAPQSFTIATPHRNKLLRFLKTLRQEIVLGAKPICIDFRPTQKFIADGTLLFWAELHRALSLTGSKRLVQCIPPRNAKLRQVMVQVGVARMLSYKHKGAIGFEDVVHWRAAHGVQVDGAKYERILGRYDGRIASALSSKLYVSIVEGMKNVIHHAHIDQRNDGLNVGNEALTWWMFSQEREGQLSVLICDLGIGIPRSLPVRHQTAYRKLIQVVTTGSGNIPDSKVIEEATKLKVTRTNQEFRGKGLDQMVKAITQDFEGKVCIQSNRGCYTNDRGNVELIDHEMSILGTLIYWKVPLKN